MNRQIENFLDYCTRERKASENTITAYRSDLDQLVDFLTVSPSGTITVTSHGDDLPWSRVTIAQLRSYVGHLRELGLVSATLARKVAAIKSFFNWLVAESIVNQNPTEKLDSPKVDKTLPRTLSVDEVARLLAQPNGPGFEDQRDAAMLQLLSTTGLRVSEFVSLNTSDVDLNAGHIRVLGRGGRERQLPIDRRTVESVQRYIEQARPRLTRHTGNVDALFVNHHGERLTRQGFWLILKGYVRMAHLPDTVKPHTLRHSFALRLLANNTSVRDVQELLGHANVATTQIYRRLVPTGV